MRVHHLNTGTMCPVSALLVNGRGGLFERARMVCHVLLLETNDGLALVDTGLGLGDIADPDRLGRRWVRQTAPRLAREETALAQVQALGFSPRDVRHLLLTHLDLDHAGGIGDFPWAKVHVHAREHGAAVAGDVPVRPGRYIARQWANDPQWTVYGTEGESWFGFQGVRALDARDPDVLVIPLQGHTPGHCGVAVRTAQGWLLHAGDAYFHHAQVRPSETGVPLALRVFQRKADTDRALRQANQRRLRELHAAHGHEVTIFNSHDPDDYDRCLCGSHLAA
jgi:glyoxylase-like metal-dependent hydrolase (beta-lactamase superfamily II)